MLRAGVERGILYKKIYWWSVFWGWGSRGRARAQSKKQGQKTNTHTHSADML